MLLNFEANPFQWAQRVFIMFSLSLSNPVPADQSAQSVEKSREAIGVGKQASRPASAATWQLVWSWRPPPIRLDLERRHCTGGIVGHSTPFFPTLCDCIFRLTKHLSQLLVAHCVRLSWYLATYLTPAASLASTLPTRGLIVAAQESWIAIWLRKVTMQCSQENLLVHTNIWLLCSTVLEILFL